LLAAGALALLGIGFLVHPRARVKRWLASGGES
jgi:hypothetical protein